MSPTDLSPPPARPRTAAGLWRGLPLTAQLLVTGMVVAMASFFATRAAVERQQRDVRERTALLARLQRAEVSAARLGTALASMSRAHRGFVLTGEAAHLADLERARGEFAQSGARLRDLVPGTLTAAELAMLEEDLQRWTDSALVPNVARRRTQGLAAFDQGTAGAANLRRSAALMDAATATQERLARDLRLATESVATAVDEAEARDELLAFLLAAGALVILLLLLTLLLRIVRRALQQVMVAAGALADGRYREAPLPLPDAAPNREMRALADSFAGLASGMEARERQLQDDIEQLKELERLKRDFVSTVSHELRTPLTSMRGAIGLILGGKVGDLPARARDLLQIAMTNTERLIRLINDILDVEKMDAGQMSLRRDTLRLRPLVDATLAGLDSYARDHGVALVVADEADDAELVGDADRLVQVLTNLVSNAVKFSPRGAPVVVDVAADAEAVRVQVRDRGPGIPEEFRHRIFGRFQQAGGADSRRSGGTGLGLNIARTIVELHGGRIGFEPAEGGGTTFWFALPALRPLPGGAGATAGAAGGAPEPVDARRVVLVVEDDPSMADVLRTLVEPIGRAVAVHSAEEAAAVLEREPVAAIVLDPGLPGMDGFTFARGIRKDPRLRTMPIFVFTAREYAPDELRQAGIRAADVYVKTRDSEAVLFERLRKELSIAR